MSFLLAAGGGGAPAREVAADADIGADGVRP